MRKTSNFLYEFEQKRKLATDNREKKSNKSRRLVFWAFLFDMISAQRYDSQVDFVRNWNEPGIISNVPVTQKIRRLLYEGN